MYLFTLFEAYDNKKHEIAGGDNPLVVIVKEDSSGIYSVVNDKEPLDGDENELSLKIIFPYKYLKNINENQNQPYKELQGKINLQL